MKAHIGPIYLILGLMAVSALTIGAAKVPVGKDAGQARKPLVSAQALLPSPTSFRIALARNNDKAASTRVLVVESDAFDANIEAEVAKALAAARARKSG